jgi:hypothetical protein
MLNGKAFNTPSNFPSMELALVSTTSGTHVPITAPSGDYNYQVGSTAGKSIAEFSGNRPGTYILTSQYPAGQAGPDIALAISRGSPGAIVVAILETIGAFGVVFIGIVVGAVALIMRMITKNRARSPQTPASAPSHQNWLSGVIHRWPSHREEPVHSAWADSRALGPGSRPCSDMDPTALSPTARPHRRAFADDPQLALLCPVCMTPRRCQSVRWRLCLQARTPCA